MVEAAGVEPEKPGFSNFLTTRRLWSQLLLLLEFDVDDRVPKSPRESAAIDLILGEMLEAAGTVRLVSRRPPEAVRGPAASKLQGRGGVPPPGSSRRPNSWWAALIPAGRHESRP